MIIPCPITVTWTSVSPATTGQATAIPKVSLIRCSWRLLPAEILLFLYSFLYPARTCIVDVSLLCLLEFFSWKFTAVFWQALCSQVGWVWPGTGEPGAEVLSTPAHNARGEFQRIQNPTIKVCPCWIELSVCNGRLSSRVPLERVVMCFLWNTATNLSFSMLT